MHAVMVGECKPWWGVSACCDGVCVYAVVVCECLLWWWCVIESVVSACLWWCVSACCGGDV